VALRGGATEMAERRVQRAAAERALVSGAMERGTTTLEWEKEAGVGGVALGRLL
jgi:hypothetical protein